VIWRDKMALVEKSYPGRRDGNYSLIFGDDDFGSLISAIHATSIQMGNELENIIPKFAKIIDESLIDSFFNKTLNPGIYIIPKRILSDKRLRFDQVPDVLVVNVIKNMCIVFEIKLGDNFDTKKAKGEVEHLKSYASKLDKATTYRVSIGVCMWYAKDKMAVITGFKKEISESEAFTGFEFCKMTNLDYDVINTQIALHQKENRKFVFDRFSDIIKKYN
jgi:hypothetical protein